MLCKSSGVTVYQRLVSIEINFIDFEWSVKLSPIHVASCVVASWVLLSNSVIHWFFFFFFLTEKHLGSHAHVQECLHFHNLNSSFLFLYLIGPSTRHMFGFSSRNFYIYSGIGAVQGSLQIGWFRILSMSLGIVLVVFVDVDVGSMSSGLHYLIVCVAVIKFLTRYRYHGMLNIK